MKISVTVDLPVEEALALQKEVISAGQEYMGDQMTQFVEASAQLWLTGFKTLLGQFTPRG